MVSGSTLEYNITADNSEFKKALDEARQKSEKTFKESEKSAKSYAKTVRNEMLSVAGSIATVMSIQKVKEYADSWISVENRIKSTGMAFEKVKSTQIDLLNLANRTRSGLSDTAELYQKIGMNAEKLKLSEEKRLRLTETINKGFAISGATGASKAGAITQIGQGLGDTFASEELNSVFDSSITLTKALLKEFAVDSTKELKKLAAAGEVTGERVANAWINASKQIDEEFARSRGTISDSLTVLDNNFTAFIGNLDGASGASEVLSGLILTLADNLDEVASILLITTGAVAGFYAPAVIAGIGQTITLIRGIGTAGLFARAGLGPLAAIIGAAATAILIYKDDIAGLIDTTRDLTDETKNVQNANENFSEALSKVDDLNSKAAQSSGEVAQKYREQAQAALQVAKAEATKNAEMAKAAVTKAQQLKADAELNLQKKQQEFDDLGIAKYANSNSGSLSQVQTALDRKDGTENNIKSAEKALSDAENNLKTVEGRIAKAGKLPKVTSGSSRVYNHSGASSGSRGKPSQSVSKTKQSKVKTKYDDGSDSEQNIQDITSDDMMGQIEKQQLTFEKLKETQKQWGEEVGTSFANAVLNAEDFEGALKNIASTMVKDLLPELGKLVLGKGGVFGGEAGGGLGGAIASGIGSLFGGFGGGDVMATSTGSTGGIGLGDMSGFGFGGGKASGGNARANKVYSVGESGRELFMPSTNGYILPNHITKSIDNINRQSINSSNSNHFAVNMTVNASDANSFKKSQSQIIGDFSRSIQRVSGRVT
jgi:tape measure domain-containing protein